MIEHLHIRNLALVVDQEIELGPGLNTISGETGAGKSLLLGALQLLLGGRAAPAIVRRGEKQCEVTAAVRIPRTFDALRKQVDALLEEGGIPACEEDVLLLRRVVGASSSRAYVNGSSVTVGLLRRLGDLLVDIHGPHDNQSLLQPRRQLEILDAYAGLETRVSGCSELFREIAAAESALEEAEAGGLSPEEADILRFQHREIVGADLDPEEEEELVERHRVLSNARHLVELAGQCRAGLAEADGSIADALAPFVRLLHEIETSDAERGAAFVEQLEGIVESIHDLAGELGDYAESFDLDGGELGRTEERLDLIQKLKRKHGPTLSDVLAAADEMEEKLAAFDDREANLTALRERLAALREQFSEACRALSRSRSTACRKLARAIAGKLRRLGFERADFSVALRQLAAAGPTRQDGVEFCFAPNPGEEALPLRHIASSGEMARVMLAVKTVLSEADSVPVLVFDEIDANVGGRTAVTVAEELVAIADRHQVLSITHLPQIAVAGARHFRVSKHVKHERTMTVMTPLEGDAREREIVRMLGAAEDSETGLQHAKELLREAGQAATFAVARPAGQQGRAPRAE